MKYFFIDAPNFNLIYTLECGQVFRWNKIGDDEYEGVVANSIIKIKQKKNRLFVSTSNSRITPLFIIAYLDLTLDLPYIYNTIGKDKHIRAAIRKFKGLKIIRQPLWECLASFIVSSYNNIPRIKKIIFNLSRCSGKPLVLDGWINYSFPTAKIIGDSSIAGLMRCGTGFRAAYLKKAAKAFIEKRIDAKVLKERPYQEAKGILMQLDGVGQKVADCVLLYSLGRFEAFPVDVWIKRIMQNLYFNGRQIRENNIREFAREYFGEYAGYAQQYLYHYVRTK